MGLLSTYTDDNKVIWTSKDITYSVRMVKGNWQKISLVDGVVIATYTRMYEYHRYATYSYSYVGMDYATAQQCVSDLQAAFLRNTKVSEWNETLGDFEDVNGGTYLMCDIVATKRAGDMYDVQVNFREDDSRLRKESNLTPSSLFTAENTREYDIS